MLVPRAVDLYALRELVAQFPVTAILGARKCGKTTLARQVSADHYFDLANPRDLSRLEHPQLVLEGTFMVSVLQPWQGSTSASALKRPKVYLRDPGIFHSLLAIGTSEQLHVHRGRSLPGASRASEPNHGVMPRSCPHCR